MPKEFRQVAWDDDVADACRALVRLAVREDLAEQGDVTTAGLVTGERSGRADVVVRAAGVVAGLPTIEIVLDEMPCSVAWQPQVRDGEKVAAGGIVGRLEGAAGGILTAERVVLNFLGRLSGIATLTRAYVERIQGTGARIYDTRKTMPGWRLLDKYAVRCGGGHNHRLGLFDAVLIKDNHLAVAAESAVAAAETISRARESLRKHSSDTAIIEIEVDRIDRLDDVLRAGPDIVLLDNMPPATLREAVTKRDAISAAVELEASGGVTLETVRVIAETGVDRISIGALTHSAGWLDVGLDWRVS